jgi:hypothetical protein
MEKMRDRLIKIIRGWEVPSYGLGDPVFIDTELAGDIADALIAAGAILPGFRLGQEVFYIVRDEIHSAKILSIEICEKEIYYSLSDDWGGLEPEFFAAKEEAEAALSEVGK